MKKEDIFYFHPLLTPKLLDLVTDFDLQVKEAKRYVREEWKRIKRLKQVDRLYLGHFFNNCGTKGQSYEVEINPWYTYTNRNFIITENRNKPTLESPLCIELSDIFPCVIPFDRCTFDIKLYTNLDYFIIENDLLFQSAYKVKLAILCLENILYNPDALMNNEILNAQREELVYTIRDKETGLYTQLEREIKSIDINTDNIQKYTLGINKLGVKYTTI